MENNWSRCFIMHNTSKIRTCVSLRCIKIKHLLINNFLDTYLDMEITCIHVLLPSLNDQLPLLSTCRGLRVRRILHCSAPSLATPFLPSLLVLLRHHDQLPLQPLHRLYWLLVPAADYPSTPWARASCPAHVLKEFRRSEFKAAEVRQEHRGFCLSK